ncbi:MAG: preprotein translocase subunit SecY [Prevotellaceae bacterium]|jgi:preprotein translocase subunit SecY|nr:preprotein translocase subunit SecY [Prevotellaceae bacterium]
MKKFISTIQNIFKIEDLRRRIVYTILLILVYRLGSFIVLPGIDANLLINSDFSQQSQEGLLGLLNIFSGGAFGNASVFALGIMPYISASIVIQLLGMMVPYFQRLQREGESGRRKMNQLTRYLTIVILAVQAPAYLMNLQSQIPAQAFLLGAPTSIWNVVFSGFGFSSIIILIGGTMFVMWLGERITDRGIGNGISLIITVGIVARLPFAFLAEAGSRINESTGSILMLIVELIVLMLVFAVTIALVQGTRKIPVQYAKRIVGNKQYGGVRQYIPLKINAAGVMPIIFAQALMFIPLMFSGFSATQGMAAALSNPVGFWYNFISAILVIVFTYFYTAVTVNPNMMAEEMKKNGGFIPGVKPGKKTAEYLDNIMSRITLPGSIFLAIIAILPAFAMLLNINNQFAYFYGGTSLLIMVGVVLDTLQQIESHLLNRHYDGLMKTGRLKGRNG